MNKLMQYLKDVRGEMVKVSWPTWNELSGATVLVCILSVVMSLFVFACDWAIGHVLNVIIPTK
jgi:preprotein translocase subunit SecE